MKCPFCGHPDTGVKDSRPTEDGQAIRRRRTCGECGARFTTFERVQLRELTVVKSNGEREPFDREKLTRSLRVALRKRPIEADRIDRVITSIQRQLETQGETEITSKQIGETVMEALKGLDKIAYIRYASVYRNFREAAEFATLVENLGPDPLS